MQDAQQNRLGFSTKYIDFSIDPFEDFYHFACGRWIKSHKLPKDKSELGTFELLQEENTKRLKRIVDICSSKIQARDRISRLVGDFYASYMNVSVIEKKKFEPIKPIIDLVLEASKEDMPALIAKLYRSGVSTFLGMYSDSDKKNSSIYAFYIWQAGINLPGNEYYFEKRFKAIRREYKLHISRMLAFYGIKEKRKEMVNSIFGIERKLARARVSSAEERDEMKSYNKFSINALSSYKHIGMQKMLKELGLKNAGYVIIGQPGYLKAVDRIISQESMDGLKAYLVWCAINSFATLLHKEVRDEHFRFYGTILSGKRKNDPRWKRGIYRTSSMIGDAIDMLYIRKYFSKRTKKKAEELIGMMKNAFRERLKGNIWMSHKTKIKAIEKLDSIVAKVGYPKRFKSYKGLAIDKRDLVGNVIRAYRYELDRQLKRVGKKVDKEEWNMNASEVNAYYDPSMNEIVVPAGILQPPYFDEKADFALNLGGIGGILGHEMTHGFDDQGRLFDKDGNLKTWWSKSDRRRFVALASRIEKLYSSISVIQGLHINGKLTLGENIADLGGISIAYDALKAQGVLEKKIEGFTEEQRFFIAWSQIWRCIIAKNALILRLYTDPHSPESVRGLVPAVSHPAFQKAFKALSRLDKPKQNYENVNLW